MQYFRFLCNPALTRQTADELAYDIEKTSGVKPEVIEWHPDPLPERTIWADFGSREYALRDQP